LAGVNGSTSGTAIVNGWDINESIDKVRQSLGVCPQFDALIEEMTVFEMLILFARLKGMSAIQAHADADQVLKLLEVSAHFNSHLPNNVHSSVRKNYAALPACQGVRSESLVSP
jgi:ABC-type multidrug transport system ATPase subunit